jgi:threonine synthase
MANTSSGRTHTPSQTYLSTRGGDYGVRRPNMLSISTDQLILIFLSKLSFETVVLKGLAADGGLFLPEEVPIATDWVCALDGPKTFFARMLIRHFQPVAFKSY